MVSQIEKIILGFRNYLIELLFEGVMYFVGRKKKRSKYSVIWRQKTCYHLVEREISWGIFQRDVDIGN